MGGNAFDANTYTAASADGAAPAPAPTLAPAPAALSVTEADVESMIAMELYSNPNNWEIVGPQADSASLQNAGLMTVCALVLKSGFTVIGYDACVSPANFDRDLGRKYAREAAIRKLWQFAGYDLKRAINTPSQRDIAA